MQREAHRRMSFLRQVDKGMAFLWNEYDASKGGRLQGAGGLSKLRRNFPLVRQGMREGS